jgi:hypothetical protein
LFLWHELEEWLDGAELEVRELPKAGRVVRPISTKAAVLSSYSGGGRKRRDAKDEGLTNPHVLYGAGALYHAPLEGGCPSDP